MLDCNVDRTNSLRVVHPLFLDRFGLDFSQILIVYDDLDIPLGRMRVLPKGGPGTHKGMRSVLDALGSEEVPRLKIGIGVEKRGPDTVNFVLSRFSEEEWKTLIPVLRRATEAIELFRTETIETVMNRFNRRNSDVASSSPGAIL